MMIFDDGATDDDDAPTLLSDALCLLLCAFNAVVWVAILWLVIS